MTLCHLHPISWLKTSCVRFSFCDDKDKKFLRQWVINVIIYDEFGAFLSVSMSTHIFLTNGALHHMQLYAIIMLCIIITGSLWGYSSSMPLPQIEELNFNYFFLVKKGSAQIIGALFFFSKWRELGFALVWRKVSLYEINWDYEISCVVWMRHLMIWFTFSLTRFQQSNKV